MSKTRFQFNLNSDKYDRVIKLMELCGIETKQELMNNALSAFEWIVNEINKGSIIASVNEDSKLYKEFSMPVFSNIPKAEESATERLNRHNEL